MRSFEREKLFHAIIFFTQKTKACHKLKLFKLLYFLDFEMFRQTGRSTTGLRYYAWPMGPVPSQLQSEFRTPPRDMSAVLTIRTAPADDPDSDSWLHVTARIRFDESRFSPRELGEMNRLAFIFLEASGTDMQLASHEAGLPWRQVYEVEGRRQALIPYEMILEDQRTDTVSKDQADEMELEARGAAGLFK